MPPIIICEILCSLRMIPYFIPIRESLSAGDISQLRKKDVVFQKKKKGGPGHSDCVSGLTGGHRSPSTHRLICK